MEIIECNNLRRQIAFCEWTFSFDYNEIIFIYIAWHFYATVMDEPATQWPSHSRFSCSMFKQPHLNNMMSLMTVIRNVLWLWFCRIGCINYWLMMLHGDYWLLCQALEISTCVSTHTHTQTLMLNLEQLTNINSDMSKYRNSCFLTLSSHLSYSICRPFLLRFIC